jgi:hypothetical protein
MIVSHKNQNLSYTYVGHGYQEILGNEIIFFPSDYLVIGVLKLIVGGQYKKQIYSSFLFQEMP